MWALLIFVLLLIVSGLFILAYAYVKIGILKYYLMYGMALFTFIVWNTRRNKKFGKELHIHHYDLALILMSFDSYQSPYASIVHAFCHGFFIEGGARWGFDPAWENDNALSQKRRKKILLEYKQSAVRRLNHAASNDTEC